MGSKKHTKGNHNHHGKGGQNRGGSSGRGGQGQQNRAPANGRAIVPDALVGILQDNQGQLEMIPCAKKDRRIFALDAQSLNGAKPGDIILAKQGGTTAEGQPIARLEKNLGRANDVGILSLISAYEKGLRIEFNQATLDQTQGMDVPALKGRTDLRQIPLVTIDGADARDFDDAVFAERTDDGYHLIVAIADVSWYVRPGSELDKEAFQRGNSTYFADRVLPMLPEALSNGLCSLKPNEDRACIAAHLWIDDSGQLQKYKFERALMNSHARLTYSQVQTAYDGAPDAKIAPLMDKAIKPLYEVYDVLNTARIARNALALGGEEYKAQIDRKTGIINDITKYQSHDSNKLIEEFMILANVAAASALEDKGAACVYRSHDRPISVARVEELNDYIKAIGIPHPKSAPDTPSFFNEIMESARNRGYGSVVQDAILRIQAKAAYQTLNVGHFGLALEKYAHFTSPIRRYADLLVHRSLVDAFNMGAGGLDSVQASSLDKMAKHISDTEIASVGAERTANDRFAATFLTPSVGKEFKGTIQSATMAGLFVKFDGLGAVGLLPWRALPRDNYRLDENTRSIVGQNHVYRAGAQMDVRVAAADGLKGSLVLAPANNNSADLPGMRQQGQKRGHQPS